jgi:uncharacterized glyoxalase superfamily protein PhnB
VIWDSSAFGDLTEGFDAAQLEMPAPSRDNAGLRTSKEEVMMATKAKSPIPEGYTTLTPHLIFDNAAGAIDFYKKALGMVEKSRAVGPDGKIMHAELQIGNSRFMLNDAMGGAKSAKAFGGSPIHLWLYVDDCDALFKRATSAGAEVAPGPMGQLQDQFWATAAAP